LFIKASSSVLDKPRKQNNRNKGSNQFEITLQFIFMGYRKSLQFLLREDKRIEIH